MAHTERNTKATGPVPTVDERPTITVEEAARFLGISRSSAYAAAKAGELPTASFGRRLVVPTAYVRARLLLDAS